MHLLVADLFANKFSSFFALDLLIAAACVLLFAVQERERVRFWWIPILLTLLVGVSAGLPALLYLRADSPTS